mgnify:FL=1
MSSKTYWRDRELEWKKKRLKDEQKYADEIQEIYANMMDSVEKEIESFFSRYANKENITMAEAKKRVSNIDIKAFQRKAKKYVKEKNFSDEANEQMRLYNLAMRVNRLELLKANIGLELVAGHDELKSYTGQKLEGAYLEEIKRNASILGDTVIDNAKTAKTVADSSFKNATFSERIWVNQDQLKNSLSSVLSNALFQGKNPREFIPQIRKKFDVSRCNAERLLRTEIARVQTQAQAESYESNGIDEYEYIACSLKDVCPLCKEMDGKVFKLKDMEIGENAPPMHPNCHCATAPHSDRKEYEKWLDGLANGEHSLRFDEWKTLNAQEKEKSYIKETGKTGPCHVDAKLMNSKKYHDKFEGLTRHKAVSESLYQESLKILSDNNDTEFEHIVAIDAKTGKVLEKNMDAAKRGWTHQCGFSLKQSNRLEDLDRPFEVLHNHPNSSLPSRDDILKLYQRKNQVASTISCHDGTVHRLVKLKEIEIDSLIEKVYHDTKVKYQGYSEGAIESKCSESLIKMLNKMGCLDYAKK